MSDPNKSSPSEALLLRREFIKRSAALAVPVLITPTVKGESQAGPSTPKKKQPNIIVYVSDQFRWDALGAYGLNSMGLTPNLDAMARRGTLFRSHITNQPVCAPSRACLLTGQYQNKHGVWMNSIALSPGAMTLAKALRQAGYTANYIGKWHLAPFSRATQDSQGPVAFEYRGGFEDLWEGSNILEMTSQPYEGIIYDGDGKPIRFSGVYRSDFLTERAVRFLQTAREPFLLIISQVEPHHQNDCNCFVGPKGYADRYTNPFVPQDLRFFPGDWQKELPNYYGCIARIDESVGTLLKTLSDRGLEETTVFAFLSDHGCHFRTRNSEYKRSPHESSIHIPLVIQGPGFNRATVVPELTSQIDVAPTLLDAVGVPVPETMQGRSAMPLVARQIGGWTDEVYVQISETQIGRALRTAEWTYAVVAPRSVPVRSPSSDAYEEYQMYNLFNDPHQLLNLAGRDDRPDLVRHLGSRPLKEVARDLRRRLQAKMIDAGEPESIVEERLMYP